MLDASTNGARRNDCARYGSDLISPSRRKRTFVKVREGSVFGVGVEVISDLSCLFFAAEEEGLKSKPKKPQEGSEMSDDATAGRNTDVEAPPPPQISNPSPPPPPRIYAEDLKKDKRKRDTGSDKLEKRQRLGEGESVIK